VVAVVKIVFCNVAANYVGQHEAQPDPEEPGFCYCGFELDEHVHTDREKYAPKEGDHGDVEQ
jgi:hypothetical protein